MRIRLYRAKLIFVHAGAGIDFEAVVGPLDAELLIDVYAGAAQMAAGSAALALGALTFLF